MRDHAEKLGPLCIYHGNCADGFTAAWVVWRALGAFGAGVEFVPGFYGMEPPPVGGRDVILVDFSFKRPVLEEMARSARSILILDHHKTAAEDLAGFPPPDTGGWENPRWAAHLDHSTKTVAVMPCRPAVIFDMERSGAQIAWDFFYPCEARPALVDYVADRDLWRFALPDSRAIAAAVFSYPYDFSVWEYLALAMKGQASRAGLVTAGEAIERKHQKDITELVGVARQEMVIGGMRVPVANLPYTMASDAAHLLAFGHPFAACYFDRADVRVFSLRSRKGGADVAEIAAAYGGGGHEHAAGFQRPHGWSGDDCWSVPGALAQGDRVAQALAGLIRFRNWELAEGGVVPPDLQFVWQDAEQALRQWGYLK